MRLGNSMTLNVTHHVSEAGEDDFVKASKLQSKTKKLSSSFFCQETFLAKCRTVF